MRDLNIGFIGLGLIGGSIAKALKKAYPTITITVYNRSEKARLLAKEDHTADVITAQVDDTFSACDYIFLCTPVEHNISYLEMLKPLIKDTCIITDVGSVKGNIHQSVIEKQMTTHFIGGHPMAGSEKTGYEHSSALILENAYYVLTPSADVEQCYVDELYELVSAMKCIPVVLDYQEHDYSVAAISHIPHLIASSLVNLVQDNDSQNETMKLLAAGGFKDITRIASSSPDMWQQIALANSENIVELLDKYIASLTDIRNHINQKSPDYVYHMMEKSRDYRNSFSDRRNTHLIHNCFRLYCDIEDESGAISLIATFLAIKNVSIKNIGITHNREHEEGVLRIEFYSQEDLEKATTILKKANYTIYL